MGAPRADYCSEIAIANDQAQKATVHRVNWFLGMYGLEPEIEAEYERVLGQFPNADDRLAKDCLTVSEILRAHFLIANHFYLEGRGLGGIGPSDNSLLESAVSRQDVFFDGRRKWSNPFDVCATLFFGLIKNHAFYDANKRTAFLCALFHLLHFKRCPSVSHLEFENLTVEIADDQLDKYSRYRDLKKNGQPDSEIRFIAYYLKKNTRQMDHSFYTVTYKQLQSILHNHGYSLENTNNNYIDICRVERKNSIWKGEQTRLVRVGQIGFPRWTAQVNQGAIKTVRTVTQLDAKHGVDSASFFRGLDTMQSLIANYHEPLMRLAER